MSYRPVVVRMEFMFRNFCMGLTNPSREMVKWLRKDLEDNLLILSYGWDTSNLANEVKTKV